MDFCEDVRYVGVNDFKVDLFEGQFSVPDGMSYNSYVITDEKTAVMDSVEAGFCEEWIENIKKELSGKAPDYLVVSHMEPDHSGSIVRFMAEYPAAVIVASAKAFAFMKQFYGQEYEDRRIVSAEGQELRLGKHVLKFVAASMVHWPEVMMSYDETSKVFFSADAFGKFGAVRQDAGEWDCEARRYYFGIVGKYGAMVQALLKKLSGLEIRAICPLHGPVLSEDIGRYVGLYDTWSSYRPEEKGILIAFTSVYGNTEKAVKVLADELKARGIKTIVTDLARDDMAEAVEDTFRYGKIVLATTTYNGDIFPFMRQFIGDLTERGIKNKKIALIENGSWGPMAIKKMTAMLEGMKNIEYAENAVTIKSAPDAETDAKLESLAEELLQ